ncbi:ALF repeat-containing protein [Streptomyces sp. PTD5-9]|uniref:ALF repeat-containing protein n=1 Tax=Streptomyces sp. PTD5-9 TaxID=3120150 RepID=UPI003009FE83
MVGLLGSAPATAAEPPTDPGEVPAVSLSQRGVVVDLWKSGGPAVKAAAEAALTGTDEDVMRFLAGAGDDAIQDNRVGVAQLAGVGGKELLAAARAALAGPPENLWEFLWTGWQEPLEQDQRVLVAQIIGVGGPEVQETGRAVLAGSAEDMRTFLNSG